MTARILVVDDVPANLRLLEARLSAEYFDVVTAASGAEALALCERDECDLVLLDVMMPDMDGFEVCRRLKVNPATHHIPVVMVTALDQATDRVAGRFPDQAGFGAGADRPRPLAGAAQDDDRRVAHARGHVEGDRAREPRP
jgi:CheY-like chemotaxis protein